MLHVSAELSWLGVAGGVGGALLLQQHHDVRANAGAAKACECARDSGALVVLDRPLSAAKEGARSGGATLKFPPLGRLELHPPRGSTDHRRNIGTRRRKPTLPFLRPLRNYCFFFDYHAIRLKFSQDSRREEHAAAGPDQGNATTKGARRQTGTTAYLSDLQGPHDVHPFLLSSAVVKPENGACFSRAIHPIIRAPQISGVSIANWEAKAANLQRRAVLRPKPDSV